MEDQQNVNQPATVPPVGSTSNAITATSTKTPPNDDDPKLVPVKSRESARYCWVCFASDEDDLEAAWVQPCKCRGTTKWVKCMYNSTINLNYN